MVQKKIMVQKEEKNWYKKKINTKIVRKNAFPEEEKNCRNKIVGPRFNFLVEENDYY